MTAEKDCGPGDTENLLAEACRLIRWARFDHIGMQADADELLGRIIARAVRSDDARNETENK